MRITGQGFVNGNHYEMSSTRGELQGQVALAIMIRYLFDLHTTSLPSTFICNNQGVIQSCQQDATNRIQNHHWANIDMLLEFKKHMNGSKDTETKP